MICRNKVYLGQFIIAFVFAGMNDGSTRTTFASGKVNYPSCLYEEMQSISIFFDKVDDFVSDIIKGVAGNGLKYQDEETVYDLKDTPMKDHVHVYTKSKDLDITGETSLIPFDKLL